MTTTARINLRLTLADKERIVSAAGLRGMALSAFARDAALCEAQRVTAAERQVTLSVGDSRCFLKALDAPFAPNATLKKALARVPRG